MHGAGGAKARTQIVHADDKKAIGVQGLARADHVVPPAFAVVLTGINTGHMVRGVERVTNQDRIAALRVELAVGFISQLVRPQRQTTLQTQGLGEWQGMGVGNQGHGALWVSLDGARSSPFLAEFIDAPAISSKSALVIILAKAKGKILFARSSGCTHRSFTSPRHADP